MPLPLAISTFVGCLSTLARDGVLIDLATPTRSYGVKEGCPPLGAECSSGECNRGECVPVWNGTLCSCEGDEPLCQNCKLPWSLLGVLHLQMGKYNKHGYVLGTIKKSVETSMIWD